MKMNRFLGNFSSRLNNALKKLPEEYKDQEVPTQQEIDNACRYGAALALWGEDNPITVKFGGSKSLNILTALNMAVDTHKIVMDGHGLLLQDALDRIVELEKKLEEGIKLAVIEQQSTN